MCVQNQSKINQTRKKKKSRSSLKNQINLKSQNKIFLTCQCYQTWGVYTIKYVFHIAKIIMDQFHKTMRLHNLNITLSPVTQTCYYP